MSASVNVYSENAGISPIQPVILLAAAPPSTLINYPVGQIAVVPSANTAYILTSKSASNNVISANWTLLEGSSGIVAVANGGTGVSSLTAHGVVIGEGTSAVHVTAAGTNGQVLLGSTGADPVFGTLTSTSGVSFTTGAGSLAINVVNGGNAVTSASTGGTLAPQNTYVVTQAAQTSFALPAAATVGQTFSIASSTGNTSGWIITQGAGQEIWANTNHTTNGATGTLAGAIHTSVVLMCVVANTEFIVIGGSGLTGLTFT